MGHDALVRALSFDPSTGRLVSASYDKSVKLWDLGTGELLLFCLFDRIYILSFTGKLVREFLGTHNSHIFDVKFDVARIVRWVLHYVVCRFLLFLLIIIFLFLGGSTSHDQKIVVLDFSAGLDVKLFV